MAVSGHLVSLAVPGIQVLTQGVVGEEVPADSQLLGTRTVTSAAADSAFNTHIVQEYPGHIAVVAWSSAVYTQQGAPPGQIRPVKRYSFSLTDGEAVTKGRYRDISLR